LEKELSMLIFRHVSPMIWLKKANSKLFLFIVLTTLRGRDLHSKHFHTIYGGMLKKLIEDHQSREAVNNNECLYSDNPQSTLGTDQRWITVGMGRRCLGLPIQNHYCNYTIAIFLNSNKLSPIIHSYEKESSETTFNKNKYVRGKMSVIKG
jgi:hypothetical protein